MTRRPEISTIEDLVTTIKDFYSNPSLKPLNRQLTLKRPFLKPIFALISLLAKTQIGRTILFICCCLCYPKSWFSDSEKEFYVLALTENNTRALNRCLQAMEIEADQKASINTSQFSIRKRLGHGLESSYRKEALRVLRDQSIRDPFVIVNVMMGLAVLPMFFENLQDARSKTTIVANDHSPAALALIKASQALDLATCYIQHGPVTKHFPPLDFDLALLHNVHSQHCYQSSGVRNETKIRILPAISTPFIRPRKLLGSSNICIALSFFPDLEKLEILVAKLKELKWVDQIILKQHPRCKLPVKNTAADLGVSVCPPEQHASEIASEVDLCIVSNSGVTTEFLHAGCPTVFWPDGDTGKSDYYGFLEMKIIPLLDDEFLRDPSLIDRFFDRNWRDRFSEIDPLVYGDFETYQKDAMAWFSEAKE